MFSETMVLGTALFTIAMVMRNIQETVRNFTVNIVDTTFRVKSFANIAFDFTKFKCIYYLTCLFEYYFVKECENYYEVSYFFLGSPYKIIIEKRKGCKVIPKIIDITTDKNITSVLYKELGPYKDFHQMKVTPRMLGYPDGLLIFYKSKEERVYRQDEVIFL